MAEQTYEYVDEKEQEVFEYLDALRKTGITNMFGAGEWIENNFDMDRGTARGYLTKWMKTFRERHPE